ncbi:MAG TPA: glycosyltransferase family 39 protein [Ignavibacteria bacterium]|nr:glycosyltransferase family 39 protein [Ignavibacteria bacterium]
MKKNNYEKIIIQFIILAGIVNSVIQYLYNRSLWLDESMLALNIINKSNLELLYPLDFWQVSPVLFLQLEKITSLLIPESEYGLRLIPLIGFFISVYLMYKISDLLFDNKYGVILAMSLFVFSHSIIYYSSEVKQYMTDVLSVLCIYYFILKYYNFNDTDKKKYFILAITGVIMVFLSNVAPIILFGCGLYMLYEYFKNKKDIGDANEKKIEFKYTVYIFLAWLAAFSIYFYFFIYEHPSRERMIMYWANVNAFLPQNPFKSDFYIFLYYKSMNIFYSISPLGVPGAIGLFFLFVTGVVNLFQSKKLNLVILTLTPVTVHLLLSSFRVYPFDLRLTLYAIPSMILICSYGFIYLAVVLFGYLKTDLNKPVAKTLAVIIPITFLVSFYTTSKKGFPIKNEEIKQSLGHIYENYSPTDKIYLYWGASKAFQYYKDINFVNEKIPVVYGNTFREKNEKEKYIDEIRTLKGRNWLLFSFIRDNDDDFIIRKLDSLGYKKLSGFETVGSGSYLYDFGE